MGLDKMRKHSFGSVAVLQDTDKLEISGVWFWKGQDLAFDLCADWQVDYETYDWTKLDSDNADHRMMVQEYFAWEGKFGGKGFKDAKVYKKMSSNQNSFFRTFLKLKKFFPYLNMVQWLCGH